MSADAIPTCEERAQDLHHDATIVLGYVNPVRRYFADGVDFGWFAENDPAIQGSLPRLEAGGVDVVMLSYGLHTDPLAEHPTPAGRRREPLFHGADQVHYQLRCLDALHRTLEAHADRIEVALTAGDIARVRDAGKIAAVLHLTGAWIHGDLAVLRTYHRWGVRAIHVAMAGQHGVGDATGDAAEAGGLTPWGREIVREMERLRMLVDVSHATEPTFWDILETATRPVIASHSNARALCDLERNLTDEQARALAATGGVIGVHFSGGLIDRSWQQARARAGLYDVAKEGARALRARHPNPWAFLAESFSPWEWPAAYGPQPEITAPLPTVAQLVDHIDHLVQVAGIDHVAIGSDYDLGDIPTDLDHAGKLPHLTAELLRRGYREEEIRKIWGENFLRVFRDVLGA